MSEQVSMIDLLLRPELPNVQKELPQARYKIKRLSDTLGSDVVFTLRGLPYGRVQTLRESSSQDTNIHIVLAGCIDPDFKSPQLQERFSGVTPAEVMKAMLLPGEIEDLARAVEQLCGYRRLTIEEVKNG